MYLMFDIHAALMYYTRYETLILKTGHFYFESSMVCQFFDE